MAGAIAARAIKQAFAISAEGIPDEELLARFLDGTGTASEDAFRVLVARHGPRVLGICRNVLDREHDAEDAFQATFLALARNGATIRDRCALGGWLQEVAYRTSLKTRARRSRRRTVERQVMTMIPPRDDPANPIEHAALDELRPVLHEEVTGLPDKYRIPVVLSYLEGKTNEEVAELLHWPVGTVKGRLSRGRALLRSRLMRRGVGVGWAVILMILSRSRVAAAEVPPELLEAAVRPVIGPAPEADPTGSPTPSDPPDPDLSAAPGSAFKLDLEEKAARRRGRRRVVSTMVLLLAAFLVAVSLGGYVSAAMFGGKLPDLRSAFSGWLPSRAAGHGACPAARDLR